MFFKKFWLKIYSFFIYLSNGLREGEKMIMGDVNNALNEGISDEQQTEHNSVWQDLVNHELTQRVIDLRYETEHVNRRSKEDYEHIGGGVAVKKNKMFEFKGNIENSRGDKIIIVQDNNEDIKGVLTGDVNGVDIKEYRLKLTYDFLPRLRLDAYVTKIVVKGYDENKLLIDLYVSKYRQRYENKHKFFLSAINRILNGDRRSDILDISEIKFTTNNAFGVSDGITKTYDNINFLDILEFDGSYILRFGAHEKDSIDYIDSVYNEESERKFNEKERRETFREDLGDIVGIDAKNMKDEDYFKNVGDLLNENGLKN